MTSSALKAITCGNIGWKALLFSFFSVGVLIQIKQHVLIRNKILNGGGGAAFHIKYSC